VKYQKSIQKMELISSDDKEQKERNEKNSTPKPRSSISTGEKVSRVLTTQTLKRASPWVSLPG